MIVEYRSRVIHIIDMDTDPGRAAARAHARSLKSSQSGSLRVKEGLSGWEKYQVFNHFISHPSIDLIMKTRIV
jgi:hypothetical protein